MAAAAAADKQAQGDVAPPPLLPSEETTAITAPATQHLRGQHGKAELATRPVLLVGGSDGSGTRSFVDLLLSLGVAMSVDDAGTMDVHGWEMEGGWPPIVKQVRAC